MASRPRKATWTSAPAGDSASPKQAPGTLRERLAELSLDRTTPARELVLETCAVLRVWVHERPLGWTWSEAGRDLREGLEAWTEDQGWRAAAARLLVTLEATRTAFAHARHGPREVVAEELGLWLRDHGAEERAWNGRPLEDGARFADPRPLAEHAVHRGRPGHGARGLTRGETILVLAPTETVTLALEHAREEGLEPSVLTGQGGPCVDGLRLARRLRQAGVAVAVTWDAALVSLVDDVDRIWLGTEAADGERFLAPVGTEPLLRRARELGVPAELLLDSDQRTPEGLPLRTPAWSERDDWLLWDSAPAGVELRAQAFAAVPLEKVHVVHLPETTAHDPVRTAFDRTPIQA